MSKPRGDTGSNGRMLSRVKKTAATLCVTAIATVAVAAPAGAQQNQDGLVNVAIGDITIEDVNVGVAAAIAANVCNVKVGPVAVLATQVDASGGQRAVCDAAGGVTLEQN
jgi:hypothetical protein